SAITMLAATVLRSAQDAPAQRVLAWAADEAWLPWQRAALLRGAEVALLGATMPGTVARERPQLGARGGPAGEFKFARTPGTERPPGAERTPGTERPTGATGQGTGQFSRRGGGFGGARSLRLSREPATFSALAAGSGENAARAKSVLARIDWPGKPGSAAPVAPLSAAEQQRFD